MTIVMSVSVCLSIGSRISETTFRTSRNFLYMLTVVVARRSSDDNATCYVFPVLWMTLSLPTIANRSILKVTRQGQHRGRSVMPTIALCENENTGCTSGMRYSGFSMYSSEGQSVMRSARERRCIGWFCCARRRCRKISMSGLQKVHCGVGGVDRSELVEPLLDSCMQRHNTANLWPVHAVIKILLLPQIQIFIGSLQLKSRIT